MKTNLFNKIIIMIFIVVVVVISGNITKKEFGSRGLYPSLPRPIAKETVLITSAGQSTDTYIVKDIANKLLVHNFFMPQAGESDLIDVESVIVVVGYSEIGEKLHDISFFDEKKRVSDLIEAVKEKDLPIIVINVGAVSKQNTQSDELMRLVAEKSNYMIGTFSANEDNYMTDLAEEFDVPLTLVEGVRDISEPFASAFR